MMIEVKDLTFRYQGQSADTLHGISFCIEEGQVFGFLGPSGSGKSTTQKLLIGLLTRYQGRIAIMGRNRSDWGRDFYKRIGVSFELPNHFTRLTALENLRLFQSFYGSGTGGRTRLMNLLSDVGLEASADQRVSEFSKGMKMRLNFARALINDPPLLFLDEPTAGLDPVSARSLKGMIQRMSQAGKTVFLTTHNMHDADELCDQVAFLVDGRIRLIGVPTLLKREHGVPRVDLQVAGASGQLESLEFALEGLGNNAAFLEQLRNGNVVSLHSREASLEDVFIQTTGRALL